MNVPLETSFIKTTSRNYQFVVSRCTLRILLYGYTRKEKASHWKLSGNGETVNLCSKYMLVDSTDLC